MESELWALDRSVQRPLARGLARHLTQPGDAHTRTHANSFLGHVPSIGGRRFQIDAYGVSLARALLADGLHIRQSRATERAMLRPVLEAGVPGREQPSSIFAGVLPQEAVAAEEDRRELERQGMVPDGVLSLPGRFPRVSRRADRAVAARDFLIEIVRV